MFKVINEWFYLKFLLSKTIKRIESLQQEKKYYSLFIEIASLYDLIKIERYSTIPLRQIMNKKMVTHFKRIYNLEIELSKALFVIQDSKYVDKDYRLSDSNVVTLDDYLTDNKNRPMDLIEKLFAFKETFRSIKVAMEMKDDDFKNYYSRKYSQLFMESCLLLLSLEEILSDKK